MAIIPAPARGRTVAKRVLLGRAKASSTLEHTLLPKLIALPVFSSDPLSSNAYATEEILTVLLAASAASMSLVMPIAFAIALLMVIVITSYRQTVRAYPRGGGAYLVSKDNLGTVPGLVAASALMIDYVLTVAVSITAGVVAVTTALPNLAPFAVQLALVFVALLTLANLRGVKEAGMVFAVPTYAFVASIFVLVATGLARCAAGGCPAASAIEPDAGLAATVGPVSLFVILHAFSSGSTALTGVEAISDGVPAFRRPQAENAARTLGVMGAMAITMFLGISFLATHIPGITVSEERSVVGQIADAVFGGGIGFYVVQAFTAAILVLAANTAYQDFPRLSSILAQDRFMPSQFRNRGDRLVFSNGVLVLAVLAGSLIVLFDADLSRLIQLYVVGVFTSFTLSQSGMVRHWLRLRRAPEGAPSGWRRSIAINAVGAVTTGLVLVVTTTTKFTHGAWIVIAAVPVIVTALVGVHRHYERVAHLLATRSVDPRRAASTRFVFLVRDLGPATKEAIAYVRTCRPRDLVALYVGGPDRFEAVAAEWPSVAPRLGPLERPPSPARGTIRSVKAFLRTMDRSGVDFTTVVVPELVSSGKLGSLSARNRTAFLLKASLLLTSDVVVTDVPLLPELAEEAANHADRTIEANRHVVLVPVSSVHDGTVRAMLYARSLRAAHTEALYFADDPEGSPGIVEAWWDSGIDVPLSLVEAPFRDLGPPLLREIRNYTVRGDTVVTVVLPELLVTRWWEHILHGQTALFFKRLLLHEPRVVVTSVPYRLARAPSAVDAEPALT
jgi:amino acid transporter